MVMAALGLISLPWWQQRAVDHRAWREAARAACGSLLLFILWGVNPRGDIIAHFGGYAAGLLLGTGLVLLPGKARQDPAFGFGCWLWFLGMLLATSLLALR
jgi:hypothetical protein